MRAVIGIGVLSALCLLSASAAQVSLLPIGAIQGAGDVSPYLNRFVNFRGVVVGRYEDENTRGDVYYTLFVQSLPDETDRDPATSDGIAVFLGRQPRPDIPLGATVAVGGRVTEFYGLTEMDDDGLFVNVVEPSGPLPEPVLINPPPDMDELAAYFEPLEGMRVAYEEPVIVAGPTHVGCGFAVVAEAAASDLPIIRRSGDDPVGRVVPVLYPSDLACDDIPQVKSGDRLSGMAGALTYNFDQFKIVIDSAGQLAIEPDTVPPPPAMPALDPSQIVVASLNLADYFDSTRDTRETGEPVPAPEEVAARREKLAHVIAEVLACPTLIAVQEVEHAALLDDLADALAGPCSFAYQVSHLDSPDARGIDNAVLTDSRRVTVGEIALRQTCSPVPTGIVDPSVVCPPGEEPLFGRPPLLLDIEIDGAPYAVFANHFKSKRGGENETGLERIRQAVYLNGLVAEKLAEDASARVMALGDFNDTDLSPALALLSDPTQGGVLRNGLAGVPPEARYSYNFGGVAELIDYILLSPALEAEVGWATVVHTNTDFPVGWQLDTNPDRLPFRVSDHDIPVVVLGRMPATPMPEPIIPTTVPATRLAPVTVPTAAPSPTAGSVSPVPTESPALPDERQAAPASADDGARPGRIPLLVAIVFLAIIGGVLFRLKR